VTKAQPRVTAESDRAAAQGTETGCVANRIGAERGHRDRHRWQLLADIGECVEVVSGQGNKTQRGEEDREKDGRCLRGRKRCKHVVITDFGRQIVDRKRREAEDHEDEQDSRDSFQTSRGGRSSADLWTSMVMPVVEALPGISPRTSRAAKATRSRQ
jgi:hypothetical protein